MRAASVFFEGKNGRVAQRRRGIQEFDAISESFARLIVLQLRNASRGALWGRNKCGVSRFLEVSSEASCWLGLNRKEGKLARRRRHMQEHHPRTTTPSAFNCCTVAESVLGKHMWSCEQVTLRVTVLGRTKKTDATSTTISTIWPANSNLSQGFSRLWALSRETAMGRSKGCAVYLLVWNERNFCLSRRQKWESGPTSTRNSRI